MTPEGKQISSMNVLVGNKNLAKALAIAKQELEAAETKVAKLSRYTEVPWLDLVMRDLKRR